MLIDRVLAGRYRILSLLGRGGMGTVWLAHDEQEQQEVVVKLISRDIASHPVAVTRFLREMRALASTPNPHIVQVLDRGVDPTAGPFLVMEKLEGEDLDQRIQRTGPLDLEEIARIARQIGTAVAAIHDQGFVHRDIKPSNVFLSRRAAGRPVAMLLDFGAVKSNVPLRFDGSGTLPGTLIGTLSRMSPEQLQGEPVDARTDIWAFALMIYELAVGEPAVDPEASMGEIVVRACCGGLPRPAARNPALPSAFDGWFARSTRPDPDERFPTIGDQVRALLRAISAEAESVDRRDRTVLRVEYDLPAGKMGLSEIPVSRTIPAPSRLSLTPPRTAPARRPLSVAPFPRQTLLPPGQWPTPR